MNNFKKKMKEKIKMYSNKKYLKGYMTKEFLTSDKDADIYFYMNEYVQLFDPRTKGNQLSLDNSFYDFIEEKTDMLENDVQIHLHIMNSNLDSKEQGMVKHMIKEHYAIELYKVQKEFNKCRNKILHLSTVGIIIFLIYMFLFDVFYSNFLFEVLSFVFSFSLWEALDAIIYTLSDIKYARENITQDLLTNVSFDE
ncbi:MAG: hypothetical protein ACI4WW_08175 [Candidatus Coprovivens sp.]